MGDKISAASVKRLSPPLGQAGRSTARPTRARSIQIAHHLPIGVPERSVGPCDPTRVAVRKNDLIVIFKASVTAADSSQVLSDGAPPLLRDEVERTSADHFLRALPVVKRIRSVDEKQGAIRSGERDQLRLVLDESAVERFAFG